MISFPGLSPLGLAISFGDTKSVVSLLRAGASLDKLTPQGHSAWHILAELSLSGHTEDIRSVRFFARVLTKLNVDSEKVVNGVSAHSLPASGQFRTILSARRRARLLASAKPSSAPSKPIRI